mgnify:CR=1 FL=1
MKKNGGFGKFLKFWRKKYKCQEGIKMKITKEDASTSSAQVRAEGDALEALVSLGYTERDARDALKKVPKETEGASERVKAALKLLSQHA